jgi:hypothetical protein
VDIILALIAVVIPAVATYLALQAGKKLIPFVDGLPGIVKQILALVVAFVFAKLSAVIGVPFPADLSGLADPTVVAGLLSGFASWLIHKFFAPAAV